jgi:hypothetical protein
MKPTPALILIFLLLTVNAEATVLTVNNTYPGAGQYEQINSAMAAASSGDTIYVAGSLITYADASITKSIVLIGPGTYSASQQNFAATVLNLGITGNNLSGIVIKGLNIYLSLSLSGRTGINFLTISDNQIWNYFTATGLTSCSNIIVRNNIFGNSQATSMTFTGISCTNLLIENNIISGGVGSIDIPNTAMQNNVFVNPLTGGGGHDAFYQNVYGLMIKNNIFYNSHPTNKTSGCTFLNNITYSTSTGYPALGGTNIDNVNPQFVNVGSTINFQTSYDYHLQAASPAHNAGSDGTDLGYYGGAGHSSLTGEPEWVPVVRAMDVQNMSVPQNGNVNVKVRSTIAR